MSIEDIRAHAHSGHWSDDDWAAALHNANTEVEQLIGERDAAWAAKDKEAVKAIDAEAALAKSDLQVEALKNVLRSIEWHGDYLSSPPKVRCPDCGNEKTEGHSEDCDLGHALHGAFPSTSEKQERPSFNFPEGNTGFGPEKQKQETCIDCGKPITSGNICMPCVRVRYPSEGDRP